MPGYSRHLRQRVKNRRAARCAAPTECHEAARPGGRALHGMNLRDGRVRHPPLRRIWKRFLLFRRGRTLAGPSRKVCHSRANPHPPRFARHLPPERGKALWEGQIPIPSVSLRSTSPLDKGSRPLPYGFQMGRGGPWASRRSMETGRPSVPPPTVLHGYIRNTGGRVRAPAPTANPEAVPSFS